MEPHFRVATAPEDFFITQKLSQNTAYLGEVVFAQYDVYVASNLGTPMYEAMMPNFAGALSYEVDYRTLSNSHTQERGRSYTIEPLGSFALIPRSTGSLLIPHASIQTPQSPQHQSEWISSPSALLKVVPPPSPSPLGFDHRNVGAFSMETALRSPNTRMLGEGIDIDLTITADAPSDKLVLSHDARAPYLSAFDVFEAQKIASSMDLSPNRMRSQTTYRLHFTPLKEGEYSLVAAQLVYFDPKTEKYAVLSAEPIKIIVKGRAPYFHESTKTAAVPQSFHAKALELREPKPGLLKTLPYFMLAPALLFLVFLILYRKYYPSPEAKLRRLKTNAMRQFIMRAEAAKDAESLYCACLSFLHERYEIAPSCDASTIRMSLQAYRIPQHSIDLVLEALEQIKRVSFAPNATPDPALRQDLILAFKQCLPPETRTSQRWKSSAALILLCSALFCQSPALAQNADDITSLQDEVSSHLQAGQGIQALESIESLRRAIHKAALPELQPTLIYNEGLAYMALGDYGQAIARFKQTLLLDRQDQDAQSRLKECRDQIEMKVYVEAPDTVFLHGESDDFLRWSGLQSLNQTGLFYAIIVFWNAFFLALVLIVLASFRTWRPRLIVLATLLFLATTLCVALLLAQIYTKEVQFAVLTNNQELYTSPGALGSKIESPDFTPGLTLKVLARQDNWALVERYDLHTAWCPVQSLYFLRVE